MSNLLFIDVETSGLGDNAAVIEIAAIAYIDGERKHHFQSYVKPHLGCTMDAKAFEINGINPKQLDSFPLAKDVISSLLEYIDSFGCVFAVSGHNVSFDIKKIRNLFFRNMHYGSYITRFKPDGVCTFVMAKECFKGKRNKPEGNSLKKLCDYFNIVLENEHSALPDIDATIKVYEELLKIHKKKEVKKTDVLKYQEMRRKYMDSKFVQFYEDDGIYISKEALSDDIVRRFIFTEIDYIYEN
jgi:DNA polymerase III epsilon subunit-like protein